MTSKTPARERLIRKRLRRIHKLYDQALAYVLSLNAEYVLHYIVENVGEILELDHCYVMLVDQDTARLSMAATWARVEPRGDQPPDALEEVSLLPAAVALTPAPAPLPWAGVLEAMVVQNQSPMIIPDTATFPHFARNGRHGPVPASMVGIPLLFREKVIGTLTMAAFQAREFEPEEVVALSQLAMPASMTIENERLYTSLRERLREKEVLLESNAAMTGKRELSDLLGTVAAQMARVMQDAWCGLFLLEDGRLRLRAQACWDAGASLEARLDELNLPRVPFQEPSPEGEPLERSPIVTQVLSGGRPLRLPLEEEGSEPDPVSSLATRQGATAAAVVPIVRQERDLGIAVVALRRSGDEFLEGDFRILQALSNQTAIALENARLLEEEKRQTEQRELLLDAARLAASSLHMAGTIDGFAEIAARCLGASQVLIFHATQGPTLDLAASYGVDSPEQRAFLHAIQVNLEREGLCRKAIEQGRPLVQPDLGAVRMGPAERILSSACDARAAVFWPLLSNHCGVGLTIHFFDSAPHIDDVQVATMGGILRQVDIFMQNARLFEEVRLRAEQMKAISDITEVINAAHDLPTIFSTVARNTERIVPSDWTGLALVEREKNLVRLPVTSVAGDLKREAPLVFPLDESLHHAVIDGRPVICDDLVHSRSAFEKHLYDQGLRSVLIVPLIVDRKTVATLSLASRRPNAFTSNQVEILQHMADHLATAIKNAGMFEEITRMNHELRKLDAVKSDFLSTVAHELRTPLTIIKGYLFVLLKPQGLGEFVVETLETIDNQADHLKELIENLLSLSRLEASKGVLTPNMQKLHLSDMVDEVVSNFRLAARKKGIRLSSTVPHEIVLQADRSMLVRVFYNLVGNALKFTSSGRITVSAQDRPDGSVLCEIEDSGSGIAPEHLERIFERFYHVDSTDHRAPTGTGLGLSIVESIVHAHGGRVWVESTVGAGTKFSFELPCQPDPTDEDDPG